MTNEPIEPGANSAPIPSGDPAPFPAPTAGADSKIEFHLGGGIGGHPKGLNVLFFTEMWERFSYYGMRAILVLFMVAPAVQGGLGFSTEVASNIYGTYTMCVYLTSIPGGLIADKIIGPRRAILFGGAIIALGHFTMAFSSISAFYGGLTLIVLGTGLLKPNISTMVGRLYSPTDNRRDAGFSIFYMSINIGAFLSPLVCGTLAQGPEFKALLIKMGLHAESSWHYGFAAAGVGMCIGLAHLLYQYKLLDGVGERTPQESSTNQDSGKQEPVKPDPVKPDPAKDPAKIPAKAQGTATEGSQKPSFKTFFTMDEWRKLGAIALLLCFAALFWSIYEQGGSSLNLFADELTNCSLFGFTFPSSWFQALQPIYVIALCPVFSWLWIKMAERQPSSPAKFALGLLFLSMGILVMVPASMLSAHGKVTPWFLITVYFVQTLGELCLSPVGLSTVTKLAPRRFQALTMGAWFVSSAIGNKMAGYLSSLFKFDSASAMVTLYGSMSAATFIAAMLLFALTPKIKQLMGSVK
jgi:POT family proton-dependent oligopeptide transporter